MTHLPVFILLSFFLSALLIPLVGRRNERVAYLGALLGSLVGLGCAILGMAHILTVGPIHYHLGGWAPPIGIELVLDALSAFMALVITGAAFLVFWHGRVVTEQELKGKGVPFYSAAMLLVGGLLGIVITGDLFNLYVFLEISSLAGYAVLSAGRDRANVSAFRYLILGTVGASFYLLGLGFIFMVTGSLNMADVALILPEIGRSPAITVGMILIATGIGLKMALFPMHTWLPDAYSYASSTATALMAPIGTKVAAYTLIRIFFFVFTPEDVRRELPLTLALGYLGAVGIIWGSVMAIAQSDLKRMLAYSSVAQVGYIALGIGLASPLGLIGAVLHILNHACMKGCLFLVSGNLMNRLGHTEISKLDNTLRRKMPWTSASFAVAAISMIGLPPTAGFFSKWYLVLGSVEQSHWLFVAVILISSLLNAVYFFRVLEKMYLKPDRKQGGDEEPGELEPGNGQPSGFLREEVVPSMLAPTLIMAVGLIVLGLVNVWIVTHLIQRMIPAGL